MRRWWILAVAFGCVVAAGGIALVPASRDAVQVFVSRTLDAGKSSLDAPATAAEADEAEQAPVAGAGPLIPPSKPGQELPPATMPVQDAAPPAAEPDQPRSKFSPGQAQASGPPQLNPEDRAIVMLLVRTTLIALHQANVTGNYTVFRDLGSPSFQQKNTNSQLSEVFGPLRKAGVALDMVALFDAQILKAGLTPDNMLQIAATLASKPVPVQFELVFQDIGGSWRLYTISIGPDRAAMAATTKQPKPAASQ